MHSHRGRSGNEQNLYKLSNQPGTQIATYLDTFDTHSLITGAAIKNNTLTLVGYTKTLTPKVWIFKDFKDDKFFQANYQKYLLFTKPLKAQVEGIDINNKNSIFISSEKFEKNPITLEQTLYEVEF
jgi:hypothetical protein